MESRSPENLCIVHKRIKAFRISNACQIKPLERAGSVQVDHKSTEIDVEGLQVEADGRWARAKPRSECLLELVELGPWRRLYVSNGKVIIRCGSGGLPDAWH